MFSAVHESGYGTPLPFLRCSMFDSYRGRFYRVTELTRPGNVWTRS
jgi:hypothetical protein